ncbi:N-acetyltransferase B complex non catalytic subunit-domain-containing protein [Calycina marina]|uniref:N-acetyltransferase B complex non catalytic subunit-domain-containing protein n=1 Tax=Calycina marina TaxID=1763456 RepID=A0A9P8CIE4_9HELO|nr:N-acetyltransferase B complex non catalytic subunit-domain-containing protein [Calycina marina]
MSVQDFPIRDQQDVPIWSAIEVKNYKQAIKAVDKRIKKKSSEYLEALKIYIQSRDFAPATEKGHVVVYIEKLRSRAPAFTDYDAIELLDEAFDAVMPNSPDEWANVIGDLRLQRVLAKPKEDEVSKQFFRVCIYKGDLDHAEKIATALQKAYPDKHAYHFWSIATKYLYSLNLKYSEEDRTRWGRLAFAFIGKMAANTQKASSEGKLLPVRSIHTPQELLLLHAITEKYGSVENRLQYLEDPSLGAESKVAKGEWQLWRWKMELLTSSRQWKVLCETSRSLLGRARTKDNAGKLSEARYSDWVVWEGFMRSVKELSQDSISSDEIGPLRRVFYKEVAAHLDPSSGIDKSWRRNASLAKLRFSTGDVSSFVDLAITAQSEVDDTISGILQYLEAYGDATTAYGDLRPTIEALSRSQRAALLSKVIDSRAPAKVNKSTAITKLVNSYKLSYLITSAIPEHESHTLPTYQPHQEVTCDICSKPMAAFCTCCLMELAQAMTKAYTAAIKDNPDVAKELLTTDRHPADDLAILSAMCLIKAAVASDGPRPKIPQIVLATILLEYAWSLSKSNFQILLLLIKLYSCLGCASLAIAAYQRLKSKQIQKDTLSFTLFHRISDLHPHHFAHRPQDYPSGKMMEPMENIVEQQRYYKKANKEMTKNIYGCFQEGSYNSAVQITEAYSILNRSFASIFSVVESGRILRLLLPSKTLTPVICGYDGLTPNAEFHSTTISDTNDYDVFPNFESTRSPRFVSLFDFLVPETSKFQVHASLLSEKLAMLITSEYVSTAQEIGSLIAAFEQLPKENEGGFKNMSFSERITFECSEAMAYTISDLDAQSKTAVYSYGSRLCEKLQQMIEAITTIGEAPPTCQPDLQLLYMGYDLGNVILKLVRYINSRNLKTKKPEYEELATQLIQAVMKKSTAIKKKLDEGGLIDWIVDSLAGSAESTESQALNNAIGDLIDDNFREIWAGEVVESWKDSVEGFSYFKSP